MINQLFTFFNNIRILKRSPKTITKAYWEHPSVKKPEICYTLTNTEYKHPHKIYIRVCDDTTKKPKISTPYTIWPFNGHRWVFTITMEPYHYNTSHTHNNLVQLVFDHIYKSWCLNNCQGRWAWSVEEDHYFVEHGRFGWHTNTHYHLLIERDEDAVLFKMSFDGLPVSKKSKTKADYVKLVKKKNKKAGWKKFILD